MRLRLYNYYECKHSINVYGRMYRIGCLIELYHCYDISVVGLLCSLLLLSAKNIVQYFFITLKMNTIDLIPRNANHEDYKYEPDFLGLSKLPPNIILFGGTGSGKTTILINLLLKKIVHEFEPQNIYLFSNTAEDLDDSY